jgi:hypothetical protein
MTPTISDTQMQLLNTLLDNDWQNLDRFPQAAVAVAKSRGHIRQDRPGAPIIGSDYQITARGHAVLAVLA